MTTTPKTPFDDVELIVDPSLKGAGYDFVVRDLSRFDRRKLDVLSLSAAHRLSLNTARPSRSDWAVRSAKPPPRSRRVGWRLTAKIVGDGPFLHVAEKPPLYRQEDFSWRPAKAGAAYASVWPDDVLNALSAIELAGNATAAARRFRKDYTKPNGDMIGAHRVTDKAEWFNVDSFVTLADCDEAVVYVSAYAMYPWLRRTRQVGVRRSTHEHFHYAASRLTQFRRERSRLRRIEDEADNAERWARPRGFPGFPGHVRGPFPGGRWK
ncbi:MAG: hypothetical protein JSV86_16830 [Gemmatimonadota bacterium]|nr:MAG: hypothetical protein JSV86_16830 [Gemmatimonadota bacterium]